LHDVLNDDATSHVMPPLLLLVPAVLVALVTRPGEHQLNAMLLAGPRYLISLSGVFAAVAAAVIAFVGAPRDSSALELTWLLCACGSSVVAALVLWSWVAALKPAGRWATLACCTGTPALVLSVLVLTGVDRALVVLVLVHALTLVCAFASWTVWAHRRRARRLASPGIAQA
jgi:hypothetical protein